MRRGDLDEGGDASEFDENGGGDEELFEEQEESDDEGGQNDEEVGNEDDVGADNDEESADEEDGGGESDELMDDGEPHVIGGALDGGFSVDVDANVVEEFISSVIPDECKIYFDVSRNPNSDFSGGPSLDSSSDSPVLLPETLSVGNVEHSFSGVDGNLMESEIPGENNTETDEDNESSEEHNLDVPDEEGVQQHEGVNIDEADHAGEYEADFAGEADEEFDSNPGEY
ncbi:hypothetical protein X801_02947 [Opisthorchis viverrini]|uniref:Uncharacterized protein n=1 Tax=Opisthorchis viverrini TaxID=6198 RepID=A0A1S8X387_OPIVI|nr:hypothetical protein X801_02947 [Opisthorchis viverrini]